MMLGLALWPFAVFLRWLLRPVREMLASMDEAEEYVRRNV